VAIVIRMGRPADVDAAVSIFERSNLARRQATRRHYSRIHLWTHDDNERSHRLYRSRGFSPTGKTADGEGEWAREL